MVAVARLSATSGGAPHCRPTGNTVRFASALPASVLSTSAPSNYSGCNTPRGQDGAKNKGLARGFGGDFDLVRGQLINPLRLRKLISQYGPTRHRSAAKEFQIPARACALNNRVRFGRLFAVRRRSSDSQYGLNTRIIEVLGRLRHSTEQQKFVAHPKLISAPEPVHLVPA